MFYGNPFRHFRLDSPASHRTWPIVQHMPFLDRNTTRPAHNTSTSSRPTNPDNRQCRHTIDSTKHSPAYQPHIPDDCDRTAHRSIREIVRSQSICGSDPANGCRNPARMPDSIPCIWAEPRVPVAYVECTVAVTDDTQSRMPAGSTRHPRAL